MRIFILKPFILELPVNIFRIRQSKATPYKSTRWKTQFFIVNTEKKNLLKSILNISLPAQDIGTSTHFGFWDCFFIVQILKVQSLSSEAVGIKLPTGSWRSPARQTLLGCDVNFGYSEKKTFSLSDVKHNSNAKWDFYFHEYVANTIFFTTSFFNLCANIPVLAEVKT